MKEISTSIYVFEDLINDGYLYVDKTEYIYRLVSTGKGMFFCARPRRFGKSLTVSTLEAVFRGKRSLFQGLYIDSQPYDWEEYPVIHIDFADLIVDTEELLTESLTTVLQETAEEYQVQLEQTHPGLMLRKLIRLLYAKFQKGVVLLIDEYDKPILDHLDSAEEAERYRSYLDSFYQIIKGSQKFLRFVFITGITRFGKVSVFSKLNNLQDISMNESFCEMFGYTDSELHEYFSEYLTNAAMKNNMSEEELSESIREWYDGYRFSKKENKVFNPVSIGQFFVNHAEFMNYWFETGTPSFLIGMVKKNHLLPEDFNAPIMEALSFSSFDAAELASPDLSTDKIVQMLYQAGYLTLKDILVEQPLTFELGFPNQEVREAFSRFLTSEYAGSEKVLSFVKNFVVNTGKGKTEGMIETFRSFFSNLPYDLRIEKEKYYQSIVYSIFVMCGIETKAEETTNIGRIDGVAKMKNQIYIIEFKLNGSAEEALKQINEKKYAEKYTLDAKLHGKTIHKLGINFSSENGVCNITDWKEEILEP